MKVVVAGGTGVVGRRVVRALEERGVVPVVLARSVGVDVVTGQGVPEALEGVDAVVDVTNPPTVSGSKAAAFFEAATRTLLAAEEQAGVRHHVVLSIVGVDRVGTGYYRAKLRQEELALAAEGRVTVLRATQFHEFGAQWLARTRGPVVPVPRMRTAPVAAREVAEVLAEIAVGPVLGAAGDLAGPEVLEMPDVVRRTARARGDRRPVLGLWLPGAAARAARTGGLLPAGAARHGRLTFAEHLASRQPAAG